MTELQIRNRTEIRLRQAGITPSDARLAEPHRIVVFEIVGQSFHVCTRLARLVSYTANGLQYAAPVSSWGNGYMGVASDADPVISTLDQLLDEFLNAYLAANSA